MDKPKKRPNPHKGKIIIFFITFFVICAALCGLILFIPGCFPGEIPDILLPPQTHFIGKDKTKYEWVGEYIATNISREQLVEFFEREMSLHCGYVYGTREYCEGGSWQNNNIFHIRIDFTDSVTHSTHFTTAFARQDCLSLWDFLHSDW